MGIREVSKKYTDPYGFIQPDGKPSGNGLRYTSEYYLTLKRLNLLTEEDQFEFKRLIASCEVRPGLLERHPVAWKGSQQGPDDYIAVAHASKEIAPQIARRILSYGLTTGWVYNNVNPGKFTFKAWLGRQPQFVCHLFWCGGLEPGLIEKLWWSVTIIHASFKPKSDQDGWLLSWHLVNAAPDKGLIGVVKKWWYHRLGKYQLKRSFAAYFNNPDHVLARYFQN